MIQLGWPDTSYSAPEPVRGFEKDDVLPAIRKREGARTPCKATPDHSNHPFLHTLHSIEAPFLSVGPYANLTMAEMCVQCGEELAPESLFCTECGTRQAYSPAQSSTPPPAVHQANVTDLSSIVDRSNIPSANPATTAQGTHAGQGGGISVTQLGGSRIGGAQTIGEQGGSASDVLKGIAEGLSGVQESPEAQKARNAATMGIDQRREFNSPTDQLVEDIHIAEREVKGRQRQAWLEMNQDGSEVATPQAVTTELPPHLREETTVVSTPETAANDAPDPALFRRMTEVAMRRVARKRGISVEAPQVKDSDGIFMVNLTYNDDGRVLDTPDELMDAFDHAITTEASLKGYDVVLEVNIFRNQDGTIEKVAGYGGVDEPAEEKREKKERKPQARKRSPSKQGKPPGGGRRKKPPGGGRRKSESGRGRDEGRGESRSGPSGGKPPGRGRGPSRGGPSRKEKGRGGGGRGPSGEGPPRKEKGSGGGGRGPSGGGQRGPPGGGGRGPGGRPPPGPQRGGRRGPPKSDDPEW